MLKSFGDLGAAAGFTPQSRMVQASGEALHGTTAEGETDARGTVFKLQPDGSGFTLRKYFTDTVEGAWPSAGPTWSDTVLYRTTW